MLDLPLAEVARIVGASPPPGGPSARVRGVSTDTRTLRRGNLFVALRGDRYDAHDFVRSALRRGAVAAVVERAPAGLPRSAPLLKVPDTLEALGALARGWRDRLEVRVAAVTGSNGKTTTKELLAGALAAWVPTLKTEGNLNNAVGLPLTLLRLAPAHRAAAVEMGASAPGEIARLTEIARPDAGVVTNVSPAHLKGFGSLAGVARAKGELFDGLPPRGVAVVNLDDPRVAARASRRAGPRLTFGFSRGAAIRAVSVRPRGVEGSLVGIRAEGRLRTLRVRVPGNPGVQNALAAAAAARALGCPWSAILRGIPTVRPVAGRFYPTRAGGFRVVDDTYNANPRSTEEGLKAFALLAPRGRRRIAVLGEMLELGDASGEAHRRMGRTAARLGIEGIVAVGGAQGAVAGWRSAGGNPERARAVEGPAEAAEVVRGWAARGDWVYVKGSRGARMERVVRALAGARG